MTALQASPARILVVEDESIVALDLQSSLEHLGYEVVGTAATGEDAVRIAAERTPDLVLMDIQLRGAMDGTAAADEIRRRLRIPVVYLTAYSDESTLQRAQVSEPFGYLLKPFAERDLQVTIQMALYRHRAQREHEELLREQAARAAVEREQRWTKFLVDATAAMSASLDEKQTQETFVRVMVPAVADWATLHVKQGAGETVAVAHAGGKEDLLWELLKRYPPDPSLPHGYPYVIRTGRPDLVPDVTPEVLKQVAADGENLRLLQALNLRSWLCLPLTIRDETYGAITLVMAESGRNFGEGDVDRMMELARRCSTAIENARLYQLAQEAIAVREEFLSVAAHELRTPLSAILLTLYGLQRLTQPAESAIINQKIVQMIQQFDRLTALVDRLLDVSRIRVGKLDLQAEEFDLAQCVRDVTARFNESAARVGCELRVDTPPTVVGAWDQMRMEQVISNLLTNAIKFCEKKPIDVALSAADGTVALTVRDSGTGIPKERLPFIFERFERGVSARNYGGLGLGLYVTRQIVEAHGGAIEVDSELGQGSMFRVRLPRRVASS
jgi:signal transduction histidine kinase/DNA-binding NarL/FixJ family response regulator